MEQKPKSRPLEQRLKNSPLVQRQKAGSIEKENIKTPSPHLKYSQSKHASFGLSTQQKTIKKHTIRSGGSNGESVSKGKNIEFKSSKSRDKAEKVLSPSLTTPTTTRTETKRYALHKSHGKGRESKSTFSPPISTDIHTIQSHIEESKLNEQLLNALIEFKS
ncbi:MAG: hypothetical protein VXX85_07215, partial [Candidatus Margulisiibacteriota bacterium]|nr:hypothetical protein [Candidatus Margulisiibacteriota bacterium]